MKTKLLGGLAIAGAMMLMVEPAAAQACAKGPASATGRPSITAPGARLSARIAWRRSIAATKGLGVRYALLSRSKARAYSCRPAGNRTVCRLTAVPCRT